MKKRGRKGRGSERVEKNVEGGKENRIINEIEGKELKKKKKKKKKKEEEGEEKKSG